jgi:hypothetical protein
MQCFSGRNIVQKNTGGSRYDKGRNDQGDYFDAQKGQLRRGCDGLQLRHRGCFYDPLNAYKKITGYRSMGEGIR